MRLVFIAFKLNFESGGGACYELDAKINALLKLGHTATVITLFSSQNKLIASLKYKIIEEQVKTYHFLDIQKKVCFLLRKYQNEADIFHVDGQFGYGSGWYRLRGGRVPVAVHFNRELSSFPESTRKKNIPSPFSLKKRLRFIFERLFCFPIMNYNDLFTFTSPILQELYVKHGIKREKTKVLPDFFDSQELQKNIDISEIIKLRSEQKKQWTILCGGRMVPEKGLDIIIQALAVINSSENFRLVITGTGPEMDNLKKLAQEFGVNNIVNFTGWLPKEEVYKLFKQADIYVVSRWRPELTSMQVLEAMAYLVPFIVIKDTAIAWQAQGSALEFTDENYQELAERIESFVNNPALRIRLIKRGLQRLKELDLEVGKVELNEIFLSIFLNEPIYK